MFQTIKKGQKKEAQPPNVTGIPGAMKAQFENASGLSFDDVRIHYRSEKPERLHALAYTKGNQVYLAKGQEKHLGHELGHVVQQKLGLVRANRQVSGQPVNDEPRMEAAADNIRNLSAQASSVPFGEGSVVQRITEEQALGIALGMGISGKEYDEVIRPAISVEAQKSGKSFAGYIKDLTEGNFKEKLNRLRVPFNVNPSRDLDENEVIYLKDDEDCFMCIPSGQYPKFYSVNGLPLLVHQQVIGPEKDTAELIGFIKQYLTEGIWHYRGINITHFAWEALRYGVLASDGTDDRPIFTMGDPTRWLPFDSDKKSPRGIAFSPGSGNPGLSEIIEKRIEIPVGAVVPYNIDINTPVAYLNKGEKVVRGPLKINTNTPVDVVTSTKRILKGIPVNKLPEAAPYGASRDQLEGWLQNALNWMGQGAASK